MTNIFQRGRSTTNQDLYGCVNQLIPGGHHLVPPSSPSKRSYQSSRFAEASSAGRQCSAQSGPRGAACLLRGVEVGKNGELIHQKWSLTWGVNQLARWLVQSIVQLHLLCCQCYISSIHQLKVRYVLARYLRFLPDVSRIVVAKHQLWGYSTTLLEHQWRFFLLFAQTWLGNPLTQPAISRGKNQRLPSRELTKKMLNLVQCGTPPVISWFRFAPVTIVISTINHIVIGVINQLSYLGGLTLYVFRNQNDQRIPTEKARSQCLDKSRSQQSNGFQKCFYILTKIVATGNDLPTDGFFRLVVMNFLDLILYPIPSGFTQQCHIFLQASHLFLWAIYTMAMLAMYTS